MSAQVRPIGPFQVTVNDLSITATKADLAELRDEIDFVLGDEKPAEYKYVGCITDDGEFKPWSLARAGCPTNAADHTPLFERV